MQWQTKIPLIAILRGVTPEEALAHVGAVINAGFDAVEIPLNSPRWQQSIPAIVEAFGEQALIGGVAVRGAGRGFLFIPGSGKARKCPCDGGFR